MLAVLPNSTSVTLLCPIGWLSNSQIKAYVFLSFISVFICSVNMVVNASFDGSLSKSTPIAVKKAESDSNQYLQIKAMSFIAISLTVKCLETTMFISNYFDEFAFAE